MSFVVEQTNKVIHKGFSRIKQNAGKTQWS
jgi:hypothetical protein